MMRGEKNLVTVVTALEAVSSERFLFEKKEDLIGTAPDRFEVRMVDGTAAAVKPGGVYILGHSGFLGNYRFPGIKHDDPEGAKVSSAPGAGPTLYPDLPVVRFLVTSSDPKKPVADRMMLDGILYGLGQQDVRVRRLAVFELYFRPGLGEQMSDRDLKALQEAMADPGMEPLVLDHLMQLVKVWPERVRGPWFADKAREVLNARPSAQVATDAVPSLLSTCLKVLQASGRPDDAGVVSRYVASNNAYLVELALQVLEAQAPEKALPAAEDALTRQDVTGEARRLLERYVERQRRYPHQEKSTIEASRASPGALTAFLSSQHIPFLQRPRM